MQPDPTINIMWNVCVDVAPVAGAGFDGRVVGDALGAVCVAVRCQCCCFCLGVLLVWVLPALLVFVLIVCVLSVFGARAVAALGLCVSAVYAKQL